jgi:hypothetical protein
MKEVSGRDRSMNDEKFELIRQIHLNGIYAMHHVALQELRNINRDYNTAFWDCRIGATNTALAKKLYYDKLPKFAQRFLDTIHAQEICHCRMLASLAYSETAVRIAEFHKKVLEDSFVSWLACQPLIGEKMALATAIWGRHRDDPHATLQGALAEEFHQNQALAVMVALDPMIEELKKALQFQARLLEILQVNDEDRKVIGADGEICTIFGWEAQMI